MNPCQQLTDFPQIIQVSISIDNDGRPRISYISVSIRKDHVQSQFKEERIYLGLMFQMNSL